MERIDLAHEAVFRLGGLTVRPALRQIARDDGTEEVVEPRVMQVLVALGRAEGGIVSRDDLTHACWEGRVVGEDAINRVISRLRRAAEGIGQGAFRIETITKVGYRLVAGEGEAPLAIETDPAAAARAEARQLRLDRRAMLIGSGLAVVGAGGWWSWRRLTAAPAETPPPPEVAALMQQAGIAAQQGTAEGATQAIGLLRRVVATRPDYADGWGVLAISYAATTLRGPPEMEPDMRARSLAAIKRARELEPGNAYAAVAEDILRPEIGNWASGERTLRGALAQHPHNLFLLLSLAGTMLSVGRCREAAEFSSLAVATNPPTPGMVYANVQALWSAGRLEEADRAMDNAFALYPIHFAVWFTRYYLLLYTGRAQEALAMSANAANRPMNVPDFNFPMIDSVARAMLSKKSEDVDEAMRLNLEGARKGRGYAENAIQFASALGRIDTAFEIANAYFFDRGFPITNLRFAPEQRSYQRHGLFRTAFLFYPSASAMRADPRFDRLVEEIGLNGYWRETKSRPDYKKV